MTVVPCTATQPSWTFADGERNIGGLVIAPDGSAVIAGMGRVVLLSQDGTVFAKEPFGEIVAQSRDGSTIITAYSSVTSSTAYLFKKRTGANGTTILQKQWDAQQSNRIDSIAVSENGDRVAFSSPGTGIQVYDGVTGNRIGFSDEYSSLIVLSDKGRTIAGISTVEGLKVYDLNGVLLKKYDITFTGQPNSFLINSNGDLVVFNTGPHIMAVNISNGSELWKRRAFGDINMLAMTLSGNNTLAGTENGTIELYDSTGNLTWIYYSDREKGGGKAIKAVAMTPDASKIVAGSADGKIFFLDSTGNLISMYDTGKDHIGQVAIAADGSLAVAAGEYTLYAFSTGLQRIPTESGMTSIIVPSQTIPLKESSTQVPDIKGPSEPHTTRATILPDTPKVFITEYSVIRKTTQSPLGEMIGIAALLIMSIFMRRNNR